MCPTKATAIIPRGPPSCVLLSLGAPAWQGIFLWGTLKWVWLSGRLMSYRILSTIDPLRRGWLLQPRQKARLRNRFQFNNNRFKPLLQRPSILQLRLTVLTKQGYKIVHAGPATSAVQQSTPPPTNVHIHRYMA
jgi:hypothetical protein